MAARAGEAAPVGSKLKFFRLKLNNRKKNEDVTEHSGYHDIVEGLETNTDIKGLPRNVNDHLLKLLEKKEDQTLNKILECLAKKFGRSRLEKMEK